VVIKCDSALSLSVSLFRSLSLSLSLFLSFFLSPAIELWSILCSVVFDWATLFIESAAGARGETEGGR
jgi:hypothetical protein